MLVEPNAPRNVTLGNDLRTDIKLLELDEDILKELQTEGLCFKGSSSETAMLCTSTRTFAVKNVETTNLVMLVDGTDDPSALSDRSPLASHLANNSPGFNAGFATQQAKNAEAAHRAPINVSTTISSHWEIIPSAPRLHRLDEILADRPYGALSIEEYDGLQDRVDNNGDDAMELQDKDSLNTKRLLQTSKPPGMDWDELLTEVQASPVELKAALVDRGAIFLDGKWRGVDTEYLGTLLELILCTVVAHGWEVESIPGDAMATALEADGYRSEVVVHCLRKFGRKCTNGQEEESMEVDDGSGSGSDDDVYCLDKKAVCLYYGRKLLDGQSHWESVDEFMAAWKKEIPLESMEPSMDILRGHFLLQDDGSLKRFYAATLPQDPTERFKVLFSERPRWLLPDLEAYIEGLEGPGQTVEGLVFKYARANQQRPTDEVTYSAR